MSKIVTTIPSSGIPIHNQLSGLNEGNYLHLTSEEKSNMLSSLQPVDILNKVDKETGKSLVDDSLIALIPNLIPLSGTEVGKPITGTIETVIDDNNVFVTKINNDIISRLYQSSSDNEIFLNLKSPITRTIESIFTSSAIIFQSLNERISLGKIGSNLVISNSQNINSKGLSGAQDFSPNITDLDYTQKIYVDTGLSTKLDASLYNDRFKGKFTSLANLQSALPTANAGDYAQVDEGAGSLVKNYNYDLEDGWILGGTGAGATSTDSLIEGSTNLYFTTARVLATLLSGLSVATGGAIVSTDSVLTAFGKLQKQITDNLAQLFWTRTGNDITNNNVGNVNLIVGLGGGNDGEVGIYDRNSPTIKRASISSTGTFSSPNFSSFSGGAGISFDAQRMIFSSFESSSQLPLFAFNPIYLGNGNAVPTTGELNVVGFTNQTVNPTSGNRVFNFFNLSPTINQTGGANGITRGVYINPTLTAAADFRALEITAGKVIIPPATANNEAVNLSQLSGKQNNTGYLNIVSSATPVTLTASSPRFIVVTGSVNQTINLPVTSTLILGEAFNIVNSSTQTVTVNSSGGNAIGQTLNNSVSCDFYVILTSGTTAASWQQKFSGGVARTGSGPLVYGNNPFISFPVLSVNASFTAGTNAQGQGVTSTDLVVVTTTAASPSGVTMVSATGASRTQTFINRGTNPINIYPLSGTTIDSLGVNVPYLLPVNGVMVFRSATATQWYSDNDITKANLENPIFTGSVVVPNAVNTNEAVNLSQLASENNVYQFHDFLTASASEFISGQNINSGTFAQNQTNQTVNNPGVIRLTSSTTANSGASWRTSSAPLKLKGSEICDFIINPLTFNNTTFRAGIHNTTTSAAPLSGVYFEYSNSGVLTLRTANNNTPISTATIATLAVNTWYKLRITVNANATSILAEVFNNVGSLIQSVTQTTNIPSSVNNLNMGFICTNSGTTTTDLIDVDFIDLKQTLIR